MRKELSSKGFGLIGVLAVIVVLAVVGGAGAYVYHRNHKPETTSGDNHSMQTTTNTSAKASDSNSTSAVTWQTYVNTEAGLTFKYPSNWTSKVAKAIRYNDGSFGGISGTLISPSDNTLEWVYRVIGGKGGFCTPNPGDVPFADGDKCASKQILSVERLPSVAKPSKYYFQEPIRGQSVHYPCEVSSQRRQQ